MGEDRNDEVEREAPSDLLLYDAKRAELTGIHDVLNFTDTAIVAVCKYGTLSIDGEGLRIESFDSSSGSLSVVGSINGFFYFDKVSKEKKKKGLFSK